MVSFPACLEAVLLLKHSKQRKEEFPNVCARVCGGQRSFCHSCFEMGSLTEPRACGLAKLICQRVLDTCQSLLSLLQVWVTGVCRRDCLLCGCSGSKLSCLWLHCRDGHTGTSCQPQALYRIIFPLKVGDIQTRLNIRFTADS